MKDVDELKQLHEASTPTPWCLVTREVLEDGSQYPMHIIGGERALEVAYLESLCATRSEFCDSMVESNSDVRSKTANGKLI